MGHGLSSPDLTPNANAECVGEMMAFSARDRKGLASCSFSRAHVRQEWLESVRDAVIMGLISLWSKAEGRRT